MTKVVNRELSKGEKVILSKKDRLKWYLYYMSLDIGQLKIADLEKVMIVYLNIGTMVSSTGNESLKYSINFPSADHLGTFGETKGFSLKRPPSLEGADFKNLVEDQASLRAFAGTIFGKPKENHSGNTLATGTQTNWLTLVKKSNGKVDCFYLLEGSVKHGFETIKNDFMTCLSCVQIDSIKKCPECDNWFFQPTKKEKIYCNNKCASRHIVRKKRMEQKTTNSKQYEEEKKKGASRARKSYVEKVNKTYPNAKIDRRPTKHKDK